MTLKQQEIHNAFNFCNCFFFPSVSACFLIFLIKKKILILRPFKMKMGLFLLVNRFGEFVALRHFLTNGPFAVNGCRQNESPNSW